MNALAQMADPPRVPLWTGPSQHYAPLDVVVPRKPAARPAGSTQDNLLRTLRLATSPMKHAELARAVECENVTGGLGRLIKRGLVERIGRGLYRAAE